MATIRNLLIRISVSEDTNKGIRKVTASLSQTNKELDKADKSSNRFGSTLSKLGSKSLSGLTSSLGLVSKFTWLAGKGLFFVAAGAASLNTAIQAGTALAPLSGALLLLPGAALAAGVALNTLKLATSGMGDAFKTAMDNGPNSAKKFKQALQDLSPAARSVALELHKLRPELIGIRDTAQQALFAPLQGQLTAVVKTLAGPLKTGVAQVANQFGLAGRQVALFARNATTVAVLRQAFITVGVSVRSLIPALQPVLAGFRNLASLGMSFLPGMANSVSQLATRFGVWLQQIVASGRASQWIQNALATFKQLFGIVSQVGGILKSVFSAASAGGSQFLGVLGTALAKLNAFLKTAAGKSALQGIFQGLAQIGQTLGPVIGALVSGLGVLAKPIGMLAQLIGPILTTAIQALAPALAALAPGLKAIFTGLGGAAKALAPALAPLGNALAQIGIAIGPILPIVGQLIGQLVTALAPILGQLFIALGPLVGAIVKLAGAFTPLIPPIAQIIVQLVQGLVPVLTPMIGLIGQIVTVVGGFLVHAFQMLMPTIQQLLPIISQIAQNEGAMLLQLFMALAPALLTVLQAVLPLIPSLLQLSLPISKILLALTPIIVLLVKVAAAILGMVLPIVVYLINVLLKLANIILGSLATAIKWLVTNIGKIGGWVVGAFKGAGKWLWNAGKDILTGLWNGIVSMGSWLAKQLGKLISSIIPGPVRAVLGIASPSKVMAELGRFAGMGLAVGIDASRSGVSAAAGRLAGAAVPAMAAFAAPAGVAATAVAGASGGSGAPDVKTLAKAISQALHGTTVELDSKPVGQIVSRDLGQKTSLRRRTG